MIWFILGKPGAGKSLYAIRQLVDELCRSNRLIVTNLSVRLPELAQYAHDNDLDWRGTVNDRIRLISEEQMRCFFAFRRQTLPCKIRHKGSKELFDINPEALTADDEEQLQAGATYAKCDYSKAKGDGGVLYVLDEVHIAFGARAWQQNGEATLYYLSQHRKLSDDVILVSQSANLVDRQFRAVAQDFTVVRNFSKERYGFFRAPAIFVRRTYLAPPTGAPTDRAIETKSFTLDVATHGKLYDTAAGIGISGTGADTKQKITGLPWWAMPVGLSLIVAIVFWFGPKIGHAAAFWQGSRTQHRRPVALLSPPAAAQQAAPVDAPQVHVAQSTNFVMWSALGKVGTADGEIYTVGRDAIEVRPRVYLIEGSLMKFKPTR